MQLPALATPTRLEVWQFSPLGPGHLRRGPEEAGGPSSLEVQIANHWPECAADLEVGEGDCALEFEGVQGWLGLGTQLWGQDNIL